MNLECVEELHKYIILSLFPSPDIRVTLRVVSLSHIINSDDAAPILVQYVERLLGNLASELVHLTAYPSQELIIVNAARSVPVENLEETVGVLALKGDSEVAQGFLKFI